MPCLPGIMPAWGLISKTALKWPLRKREEVLQAVEDIQAGKGVYVEGTDRSVPIRKYEYNRFSIVTKAD